MEVKFVELNKGGKNCLESGVVDFCDEDDIIYVFLSKGNCRTRSYKVIQILREKNSTLRFSYAIPIRKFTFIEHLKYVVACFIYVGI